MTEGGSGFFRLQPLQRITAIVCVAALILLTAPTTSAECPSFELYKDGLDWVCKDVALTEGQCSSYGELMHGTQADQEAECFQRCISYQNNPPTTCEGPVGTVKCTAFVLNQGKCYLKYNWNDTSCATIPNINRFYRMTCQCALHCDSCSTDGTCDPNGCTGGWTYDNKTRQCKSETPHVRPMVGDARHSLHFSSAKVHPDEYDSFTNLHQTCDPVPIEEMADPIARWTRSSCATGSPFNNLTSFTFELWYRMLPTNQLSDQTKGCCWPLLVISDNFLYSVLDKANTQTRAILGPAGGTCAGDSSMFTHPDTKPGEWTHAAVTYENHHMTFYINGVRRQQVQCDQSKELSMDVSSIWLGNIYLGTWEGDMDEMRFWKSARNITDIQSTMYRTLTPEEVSQLVFYYDFDEVGAVLRDVTGNGFDIKLGYDPDRRGSANIRHMPKFSTANAPLIGVSLARSEIVPDLFMETVTRVQLITTTVSDQAVSDPITATLTGVTFGARVAVETVPRSGIFVPIIFNQSFSAYANISLTIPDSLQSAEAQFSLSASAFTSPGQVISLFVDKVLNHQPISGEAGGMLYCDGFDDYLYEKDFAMGGLVFGDQVGVGAGTVEFWAYATKPKNGGTVFSVGNTEVTGQWCSQNRAAEATSDPWYCQGRLLTHFGYGDQSVLAPAIGNNNDVSIGISYRYYDWVHVAVTFDGLSTEDHNVHLYIDGVLQKTSHAEDYYVKDIVRGLFLCHFPHWGKDYHHFNGYLDEFRIWDHKRNASQLQTHMFHKLEGTEKGLLAYYDFDDYEASYASDYTINRVTGNKGVFAGCVPNKYPWCRHWNGSAPLPDDCNPTKLPAVPCYGDGILSQSAKPKLWASTAPVGGFVKPITIANQSQTSFKPFVSDFDRNDGVYFRVVAGPTRGKLGAVVGTEIRELKVPQSREASADSSNGSMQAGASSEDVEKLVSGSTLVFIPGEKAGGKPYASFTYRAVDEFGLEGMPVTVVINALCCPGEYAGPDFKCTPCPAGSYQPNSTFDLQCIKCPSYSYQPYTGQTDCIPAPMGFFAEGVGAINIKSCQEAGYPPPCIKPYAASRTMRYIVTSFAIGGIFCALILVATVQLFRQTRVFFSASTAFLSLTLLGVIFMCAGVILMALPQTSFTCMAKYFLGNIGMSLAFGSQLLKMYRLQAIFNRRLMVVVQMRDSMLIPWLVGYVLLECMLLMIGCLAAPLKTDPVDGRCVISSRFDALYFTVVGMKVLLFFFSIYLVYATRNIPSAFNESRYIAVCLYNLFFLGVLVSSLVFGLGDAVSGQAQVTLQSVSLLYIALSTMLVLFVPKLYELFSDPKNYISRRTTKDTSNTPGPSAERSNMLEHDKQNRQHLIDRLASLESQADYLTKQLNVIEEQRIGLRKELFVMDVQKEFEEQHRRRRRSAKGSAPKVHDQPRSPRHKPAEESVTVTTEDTMATQGTESMSHATVTDSRATQFTGVTTASDPQDPQHEDNDHDQRWQAHEA